MKQLSRTLIFALMCCFFISLNSPEVLAGARSKSSIAAKKNYTSAYRSTFKAVRRPHSEVISRAIRRAPKKVKRTEDRVKFAANEEFINIPVVSIDVKETIRKADDESAKKAQAKRLDLEPKAAADSAYQGTFVTDAQIKAINNRIAKDTLEKAATKFGGHKGALTFGYAATYIEIGENITAAHASNMQTYYDNTADYFAAEFNPDQAAEINEVLGIKERQDAVNELESNGIIGIITNGLLGK